MRSGLFKRDSLFSGSYAAFSHHSRLVLVGFTVPACSLMVQSDNFSSQMDHWDRALC